MKLVLIALAAASLHAPGWAQAAAASTAEQDKQLTLFKRVTGKELQFSDFQADDGAVSVSAASMVGIAPSAVTVAESTRDVAMFVKAFDSKSKGVGFAISPARVSHPWPKVKMTDYLDRKPGAILLTGLTLSFAQGTNEVDGRNYVRRALAVTTGGTFAKEDDALWVTSNALGSQCSDASITAQLMAIDPAKVQDTGTGGTRIPPPPSDKDKFTGLSKCLNDELDKLNNKWFRSLWSVTYAIGDVRQDVDNSRTVRLGDSVAIAARWGDGIAKGKRPDATTGDDFEWGWAVSGSAKLTRNDPVLSTLDSAALVRRNTSVVALKGAIGTATMRGIAEYGNTRIREAQAGELTLNKAVGLDYRVREGWWLNFRYGKRKKASGDGEEAAGLMSLTISPSTLALH